MGKVIKVEEAAKMLGVCPATVVRAAKTGQLKARYSGLYQNRVSGIYENSVEALLKKAKGGVA